MIDPLDVRPTLLGNPQCKGCGRYVPWHEIWATSDSVCMKCVEEGIKIEVPVVLPRKPSVISNEDLNVLLQEIKLAIEFSLASVVTSAAGFVKDPPDTDHQRGYLEAIKVTAEETLQPLADVLPKVNELILKIKGK